MSSSNGNVVPEKRHSHSGDEWMNKIVIACGLSTDELILSSVFIFDAEGCIWDEFIVSQPLIPR